MPRPFTLKHLTLGFAALVAVLSGCTTYRMDYAQGNIVTDEMVSQLRPGMTRSQVRFILGTPMLADSFHPDRWDYYYSFRRGWEDKPETRHLIVLFKNDLLVSTEGSALPKVPDTRAAPTKQSTQ